MDADELFDSVAQGENTAYLISADGRLLRTNAAWQDFAEANGGAAVLAHWRTGTFIDQAFPEPLRTFYADAFKRALASGETWEHEYECSSPEVFRRFRLRIYPIDKSFLLAVHTRIVEEPHTRDIQAPDSSVYEENGVIRMCAHCRRVRNPGKAERWDWVPAYLAQPPENTSHGICMPCYEYYFPA